jgi:GDP-fucose transporter C1
MSKEDVSTKQAPPSFLKVLSVVLFYIFASITTIMLNKLVLKRQSSLPLFFLWGQLVVAVLILHVLAVVRVVRIPPVSLAVFKGFAGLIVVNVVGLALNTLCLANMDAVMYQVARSMILPITVCLSPFILAQWPSLKIIMACGVIFVGFAVGIFGDYQPDELIRSATSTKGIVFGLLSSLSTSIHSFVIKRSFSGKEQPGALDLVYYNNLFSAIMLLPLLVVAEGPQIAAFYKSAASSEEHLVFLYGTLLAGAAGLLINLAGFLQIKVTSPITHTVSSAARGVLQSLAAHFILGEALTGPRAIGISVTLLGSALYSLFKAQEAQKH